MVSKRPLKVSCAMKCRYISNRTFKFYKLWGLAYIDLTTEVQSKWDLGDLEVKSILSPFFQVPQNFPEQIYHRDRDKVSLGINPLHQGMLRPWRGVYGLQQCFGMLFMSKQHLRDSGSEVFPVKCCSEQKAFTNPTKQEILLSARIFFLYIYIFLVHHNLVFAECFQLSIKLPAMSKITKVSNCKLLISNKPLHIFSWWLVRHISDWNQGFQQLPK